MNKYLVGSAACGLANLKDRDYIILIDDTLTGEYQMSHREDCFWCTKGQLLTRFRFEGTLFESIVNFQFDREIIGSEFPIEYHILDYRETLTLLLKRIARDGELNFHTAISTNGCCTKMIYYIAYNIFILQNNSPHLTPEQKAIVQKIHDRQMPISYINELSTMIEQL